LRLEGLAGSGIDRRYLEERLHPPHDHVDVEGIELDGSKPAASP
jgi:hypothetical protein